MIPDRYAMYLRKSRADLELEKLNHEETLARHKQMLIALAERHDIPTDKIDIYHEIVSGDSIADRPEMQRLLDAVYAGKYKGVLVVEVERLARGNTIDQGTVAEAFTMANTKIYTVAKVYDPSNEFDQEYFEFGLFMSRREYKTIRRRLMAGKVQAVKEGNWIPSKSPFGYKAQRINPHERILVPDPEQSKIIQLMFNLFTEERLTVSQIGIRLTEMGIPTPSGKILDWNRKSVSEILRSPVYIGCVTWNGSVTKKIKNASGRMEKKRVYTEEKEEVFKGKHEPIISEEQFKKAQARFGTVPKVRTNDHLSNPFAGLIYCKKCGRAFAFNWYNYHGKHEPQLHHYTSRFCSARTVHLDKVIDFFVEAVEKAVEDFTVELESGSNAKQREEFEFQIASVEAEIAKLEKAKKRLFESFELDEGLYTKSEFIERKNLYNERIEALKATLSELRKKKPEETDFEQKIYSFRYALSLLKDETISVETKNEFLHGIVQRIEMETIEDERTKAVNPFLYITLK